MLLWICTIDNHAGSDDVLDLQSCCGVCPIRVVIRNVAVVRILLICDLMCCCGEGLARCVICNVAEVGVPLALRFAMFLR